MSIKTKRLVLAALFLSLLLILPLLFGQIKEIGDSLLPMHLPVMLCGMICGWRYGALVGLVGPWLRGAIFGMPPFYPNAVWMSLELMTYGLVIGLLYRILPKKYINLYVSLAGAMLAGRLVWGLTKVILLGGGRFTLAAFLTGGFADALPGIVLQFVLIPQILFLLGRSRLMKASSDS